MKKELLKDYILSILLLVMGVITLLFPLFKLTNVSWVFFGIMMFNALIYLIAFIIMGRNRDYKNLLIFIVSLLIGGVGLYFKLFKMPLGLALSLFTWVSILTLIKLKKTIGSYLKKDKLWIFELTSFILFLLSGLLASINLYYSSEVQTLVIGFFFLINGILENLLQTLRFFEVK